MKRKMRFPPSGTCIFCGSIGELTKEHIVPKWMRDLLPDTVNPHREGTVWRRDPATLRPLPPEQVESHRGSGEHRSQTLRVVCKACNTGWMSGIVDDVKPALEPLMLGSWENLSEEVQRKIAVWFALHNMVYEEISTLLHVTHPAERKRFMADHDPGPRRFMWIAKSSDHLKSYTRVLGAGPPEAPSRAILLLGAAVGRVTLLSIYDPTHVIREAQMQKIQELLDFWGLRIWPPTVDPKSPQLTMAEDALEYLIAQIQEIIGGGESKLAQGMKEILEQIAAGKWPPPRA